MPNYTYPQLEQVLNDYANNVLTEMQSKLTGTEIADKIDVRAAWFSMDGNLVNMSLSMPDYWYWADQGRAPGKMPPEEPILEWMEAHAIPITALWPIRFKIGQTGTKGKDFVHYFTDDADELVNKLGNAIVNDITMNLQVAFNIQGIPTTIK